MPMLTCVHNVSWVVPISGGQHFCQYCRSVVAKKDIYPKWDDLGAEFQRKWEAHEKGETQPPGGGEAAPT